MAMLLHAVRHIFRGNHARRVADFFRPVVVLHRQGEREHTQEITACGIVFQYGGKGFPVNDQAYAHGFTCRSGMGEKCRQCRQEEGRHRQQAVLQGQPAALPHGLFRVHGLTPCCPAQRRTSGRREPAGSSRLRRHPYPAQRPSARPFQNRRSSPPSL